MDGVGIDEPLATWGAGSGWTRRSYLQNHQWSTMRLLDANGAVLQGFEYDAYGNRYAFDSAEASIAISAINGAGIYGYTGRRLDAETGFYCFRNRYLNVGLGRFLKMDPIGRWGDSKELANPYASFGNQTKWVDPMGLCGQRGDKPWVPDYDPEPKKFWVPRKRFLIRPGKTKGPWKLVVVPAHWNARWVDWCKKQKEKYDKALVARQQAVLACLRKNNLFGLGTAEAKAVTGAVVARSVFNKKSASATLTNPITAWAAYFAFVSYEAGKEWGCEREYPFPPWVWCNYNVTPKKKK